MKQKEIQELAKRIRGKERAKIKFALNEWINQVEYFRNSYFWNPPANAAGRRSYEEKNSLFYAGKNYRIEFNVSCSCRNIYISKKCEIYGNTLNLRDAKKLLTILEGRA